MQIAITAKGTKSDDMLDKRFGRCTYFQIHNTEDGTFSILENKGAISDGGSGVLSAQQLIDEKVDVIITGNLGPNAYKLINKSGIKAYKSESLPINTVIEKYKNNELEGVQEAGKAHSGI